MNCKESAWKKLLREPAVLLAGLTAVLLLAGCGSKPSSTTSARLERAMGGGDASRKIGDGIKVLMESISKPASAFHFSYKAQKNINPKFPQDESAKPEVGPVEIEADVSPEELSISSTRGTKKTQSKAQKTDQLGWPMAQLELTGALLDPSFALAFGGAAARSAGSESVEGVAADKYEFDTSNAPAGARAGMEMAMAMMGGKVKFTSVKGAAWVDKATGRMVKFNVETDLADKAGNSWKEHDEAVITPK